MAADFTTTGLLRQTKRRGFLSNGAGLTNAAMLEVLSEQLRTYIPAFLKGIREEYIIARLSISVTAATVPAPARAVGAALRTVKWVSNDGTEVQLPRIEPERRQDYALTDSCPQAYMFQGNNLILVPAVTSGTLVLAYQQRPGQLVLPSEGGTIAGINTGTKTLTFASLPSSFTTAKLYDLVSSTGNFIALALDQAVGTVTPTTMIFSVALPAGLAVGDYVCLAEETCVPQLPREVHDLLAQSAAYQLTADTGSTRLSAIKDALKEVKDQVTTLLTPRSDGSPRVIVNRSRIGRYGGW